MDENITTHLNTALWSPDAPDYRDLTLRSEAAKPLMELIGFCDTRTESADLRELMPSTLDPIEGVGVAAHSCCSLIEYFRRLCYGDTSRLCRRFVHNVAQIQSLKQVDGESSLRSVLKSLRMFGAPPASLTQHLELLGKRPEDSPICFAYGKRYSELQYFRLEESSPDDLLDQIRSLLCVGIPVVFGMAMPSSFGLDPRIDLRAKYDTVVGYTAGVIVGYDDTYRMASLGAFTFQSCLSRIWGEDGYGWLSYELFRRGMITDIWCAIQKGWILQIAEDRGFQLENDVVCQTSRERSRI